MSSIFLFSQHPCVPLGCLLEACCSDNVHHQLWSKTGVTGWEANVLKGPQSLGHGCSCMGVNAARSSNTLDKHHRIGFSALKTLSTGAGSAFFGISPRQKLQALGSDSRGLDGSATACEKPSNTGCFSTLELCRLLLCGV